jgi:uncharacterized Fe-S center protein
MSKKIWNDHILKEFFFSKMAEQIKMAFKGEEDQRVYVKSSLSRSLSADCKSVITIENDKGDNFFLCFFFIVTQTNM